jgi:hypothetical protein
MSTQQRSVPAAYRFARAARLALGAVAVVAALIAGYAAPVKSFASRDAPAKESGQRHGNGPTGYFPDMFDATAIERPAEPPEDAPTF